MESTIQVLNEYAAKHAQLNICVQLHKAAYLHRLGLSLGSSTTEKSGLNRLIKKESKSSVPLHPYRNEDN